MLSHNAATIVLRLLAAAAAGISADFSRFFRCLVSPLLSHLRDYYYSAIFNTGRFTNAEEMVHIHDDAIRDMMPFAASHVPRARGLTHAMLPFRRPRCFRFHIAPRRAESFTIPRRSGAISSPTSISCERGWFLKCRQLLAMSFSRYYAERLLHQRRAPLYFEFPLPSREGGARADDATYRSLQEPRHFLIFVRLREAFQHSFCALFAPAPRGYFRHDIIFNMRHSALPLAPASLLLAPLRRDGRRIAGERLTRISRHSPSPATYFTAEFEPHRLLITSTMSSRRFECSLCFLLTQRRAAPRLCATTMSPPPSSSTRVFFSSSRFHVTQSGGGLRAAADFDTAMMMTASAQSYRLASSLATTISKVSRWHISRPSRRTNKKLHAHVAGFADSCRVSLLAAAFQAASSHARQLGRRRRPPPSSFHGCRFMRDYIGIYPAALHAAPSCRFSPRPLFATRQASSDFHDYCHFPHFYTFPLSHITRAASYYICASPVSSRDLKDAH